jgi:ankyrin repeat protein
MSYADFELVMDIMKSGDVARLTELTAIESTFPDGVDSFIGRRWIINAIDGAPLTTIEWMLGTGVDLSFRDDEGYTPLLATIESGRTDRVELLQRLIAAGAPINKKGINDWTPAHMAAARDDVDTLKVLVAAGADLSIRTDIDDCATPLEEAKNLKMAKALEYLKGVV